jgi:hypothetical protein
MCLYINLQVFVQKHFASWKQNVQVWSIYTSLQKNLVDLFRFMIWLSRVYYDSINFYYIELFIWRLMVNIDIRSL